MDNISRGRLPVNVAPAAPASAIDQARLPAAQPHPDLILISLAEDAASEQPLLVAQAKYAGLCFESVVVEEADGSDLHDKILALHANAKLGPGTQVVVLMHGKVRDGRHVLGSGTDVITDTAELINALRCPPDNNKPAGQWKGVVHLISCHIAAVGEGMRERLGYCVLYGGHEGTLCADGIETVIEMMRVFGLSKQPDGSAINATSLFPHLASFTGEPITLAGNGRCDLIHPFDVTPVAFESDQAEIERWTRILFSRLSHGTHAEVTHILDIMGPRLANRFYAGTMPLHLGARSSIDSLAKVRSLLSVGADIDAVDDEGGNVLMEACKCDNAELVAYLLEQGVEVLTPDNSGATPLECALIRGNKAILHQLFGHFFEGLIDEDIDGYLALAKENGARSLVEMMIKTLSE